MKLTWKVEPVQQGFNKACGRRGWPTAAYANGKPAAWIVCADSYTSEVAKSGKHAPLTAYIADYRNANWSWLRLTDRYAKLEEAKRAVKLMLTTHPELTPYV